MQPFLPSVSHLFTLVHTSKFSIKQILLCRVCWVFAQMKHKQWNADEKQMFFLFVFKGSSVKHYRTVTVFTWLCKGGVFDTFGFVAYNLPSHKDIITKMIVVCLVKRAFPLVPGFIFSHQAASILPSLMSLGSVIEIQTLQLMWSSDSSSIWRGTASRRGRNISGIFEYY